MQAGVLVHNTSGDGSWSLQWSTLWRRSGDRGEEWAYARVELPPATERVRFLGKTGFHYRSDMAIDDVAVVHHTVRDDLAGVRDESEATGETS